MSLVTHVSSASIPPGGKAQIQVYLAAPHAFLSGKISLDFDATVFGDVIAADVFSGTGDQVGTAVIKGRHVDVQFSSGTAGVGKLPNVPVLTVEVPVLTTAANKAVGSISVTAGDAPWIEAGAYRYAITAKSASLTVGGSLSVEEVRPGSGMLPAGSVVSIFGTGFTAGTTIQVDGVSLESVHFIGDGPGHLNFTLNAPSDLTGKHVIVQNPDGATVDFVSSLRGFTFPGSLSAIQPIFPQQTYSAAHPIAPGYRGVGLPLRAYALENQSLNEVTVTIDLQDDHNYNLPRRGGFILPPAGIHVADLPLTFSPNHGTSLFIYPSEPIRMVELAVLDYASSAAIASLTTRTIPFVPYLSFDDYPSWYWEVGPSGPFSRTIVVAMGIASTTFVVSTTTESGGPWLSTSPAQGKTCSDNGFGCPESSKIAATVDPSSLAPGVYNGTITVTPSGLDTTPASMSVTLHVGMSVIAPPPPLPISTVPSSLVFSVNIGAPPPPTQSFQTPIFGSLTVSTTNGGAWLSAKDDGSIVFVDVNPAGLAAGTYEGAVTASANLAGIPQTAKIPVKLVVSNNPLPAGSVAPSSLVFTVPSGGSASQTFRLGTSVPWTPSAAADGGRWLTAAAPYIAPGTSFTQQNFDVTINAASLAPGTYQGTVTIYGTPGYSNQGSNPLTVPVTLNVTAAMPGLPQAGPPLATYIVNGASAVVGAVAPGEIITIFGQNIGPRDPVSSTNGGFATTLGGTRVLFDGTAAPVLYTSATQVNAIVPFDLATSGKITVEVEYNGARVTAGGLVLAPAAPGIFTSDSGGKGQANARNADGSINGLQNPALRGSVIQIDATGEGVTSVLPLKVTIAGVDAAVQSTASSAGVLQLNAVIPRDIASSGSVPIMLTIGGTHSQDGVTIAVQ